MPTSQKPIKSLKKPGIIMNKPPMQIIRRKIIFMGLKRKPLRAEATPKIPIRAVTHIKTTSAMINKLLIRGVAFLIENKGCKFSNSIAGLKAKI